LILKLFRKEPRKPDLGSWNEIGRSVAEHDARELADFHEGRSEQPSMANDTRSPELAEQVLAEVIRLNALGRAGEARALFDPAHAPFIPELEKGGRGLTCCAILGANEFLVNQGTSYTKKTTWHLQGDRITPAQTLVTFAWSRNRRHFLAVREDGTIALHRKYGDAAYDVIPSIPGSAFVPNGLPADLAASYETPGDHAGYSHSAISDDGTKILLCDETRGIVLLCKERSGWNVKLLYPSISLDLEDLVVENDEGGKEVYTSFDMIHSALSPDGRYAALGAQSSTHYILDIRDEPSLHAKLGHLSEYPHDACFSSDSELVAFNSCHFYNGVTFVSEVSRVKGLNTQPYDLHASQLVLNPYLRVYASGYLPGSMTSRQNGAFLLAGSGFATCVATDGKVLWELGFGSSAGAVDVCPETGRVLIASYSGILHLLDPARQQDPPIFSGYKAPQELRRWLFWERLKQPLVW
jgi:hypothetical protein